MGRLIAGREELQTLCRVLTWRETRLRFEGLRKRRETRHIVLHWTGGSNPARGVFRTLRTRTGSRGQMLHLSVHLCVDVDGTAYQFADLDERCAHAGSVDDSDHDGHELSANASTIGIEIVNPGTIVSDTNQTKATSRNVLREVVREEIHGVELRQTTFTGPQTSAVLELVRVICAHYEIPIAVPMDGDHQVLPRVLTEEEFLAFRGVVGHFHLTREKRDPGLAILRAVGALHMRGLQRPAE